MVWLVLRQTEKKYERKKKLVIPMVVGTPLKDNEKKKKR
jgi:hypothetical protein